MKNTIKKLILCALIVGAISSFGVVTYAIDYDDPPDTGTVVVTVQK